MFFEVPGAPQGIWKIIDFDCACKVGQPVSGLSLDFAAPETVLAKRAGKSLPAAHAIDMFALGQIIHWVASSQSIWGAASTDASMTHLLCKEEELPISASTYECIPAYGLAKELLKKDPAERMTLKVLSVRLCLIMCAFLCPSGRYPPVLILRLLYVSPTPVQILLPALLRHEYVRPPPSTPVHRRG
jgi:hypothetical protein